MAGETVLVVDDSHDVASFLDEVLSGLGFRVIAAGDGAGCLHVVRASAPDLILLDMNMPHLTGMDVLLALRQDGCRVPVIFMTAFGSVNVAVDAFRLGVRDYLTKPFAVEELEAAVDRALQESRLARENERLSRDLIAADAVRQTVVTLSHYFNNQLMVVEHGLAALEDAWPRGASSPAEALRLSRGGVRQMAAVIRVLQRVTRVQSTPYCSATMMIDIETALREQLARQEGEAR